MTIWSKEESFITEHENSQLEIVSTDWRPVAEVVFAKERGKDRRDNEEVNLEEFIAVKGINALGNQLTKYKVNQVNLLEALPYEAPDEVHAEDIEVVDEENVTSNTEVSKNNSSEDSNSKNEDSKDDEGQTTLF